MVYKACTFGLQEGPCHEMPSVAVWSNSGRKTWTCSKHDEQMDRRTRAAKVRSEYRRTPIKESVAGSAKG